MDAKHTPGEWVLDGEDQFAKVVSQDGYTIAESDHIHVGDLDDAAEMHVANMRLIAASPDLLAACEEAWKLAEAELVKGPWADLVRRMLTEALAKAKGN